MVVADSRDIEVNVSPDLATSPAFADVSTTINGEGTFMGVDLAGQSGNITVMSVSFDVDVENWSDFNFEDRTYSGTFAIEWTTGWTQTFDNPVNNVTVSHDQQSNEITVDVTVEGLDADGNLVVIPMHNFPTAVGTGANDSQWSWVDIQATATNTWAGDEINTAAFSAAADRFAEHNQTYDAPDLTFNDVPEMTFAEAYQTADINWDMVGYSSTNPLREIGQKLIATSKQEIRKMLGIGNLDSDICLGCKKPNTDGFCDICSEELN